MATLDRDVPLDAAAELGFGDREIVFDAPDTLPGRLGATMRALLPNGYIPVVTINVPGVGVLRGAPVGFSPSDGYFEARLPDMPEIASSGLDRGGSLAGLEAQIPWIDAGGEMAQLLEGAFANNVSGAAVVYAIAHPGALPAQRIPIFTGVVVKAAFPDVGMGAWVARTDDLALLRDSPKAGWRVTKAVFGNCHADADGKVLGPIYGIQDSQAGTNEGIVECLFVDTIANEWGVGAGKIGVTRVYDDGTAMSSSNWTASQVFRGGRTWTIITLVTPAGGNVTCDAVGYDLVDSAGGNVGTNPADIFRHFLSNFVFGDWATGPWLGDTDRIDLDSFAAIGTFLGLIGYRGGRIVSEPKSGYSHVQDFLLTFYIGATWNPRGQITLLLEPATDLVTYAPAANLVSKQAAGFAYSWDDQAVVGDLVLEYNDTLGDAKASLEVMNPKDYADSPGSVTLLWLGTT